MEISYLRFRRLVGATIRNLRSRATGWRIFLQPIDQVECDVELDGRWKATGTDPQFSFVSHGFPLKAGWHLLSCELADIDGDRLQPKLYLDHGHGMHEAWTIYLTFTPFNERVSGCVVLLPKDVLALRFDPASVPCNFIARNFSIRRLSRLEASWYMIDGIRKSADVARSGTGELMLEAWRKVQSPGGRRAVAAWLVSLYQQRDVKAPTYDRWLRFYDSVTVKARVNSNLLISVLLPTYNTPSIWLRRCLDSMLAQSYPHWELCVADDASVEPQVRIVLEEYARRDKRIHITWRERNGHISAASNTALEMAHGDYVALLDHDDELHPLALATIVEALLHNPHWQFVYTDEDKIDANGHRYDPYFKPDWNPDLFCGQNCVSHLGVFARDLVNAVGGFREGLEGSQDWDLALRCSERLNQAQIGHVPRVLYHWRAIAGSTAQGVDQKSYAHDAGRRAVSDHFSRQGIAASVIEIDGVWGAFRVQYPLPDPPPLISIVIPTRDRIDLLKQCVDSILKRTTYQHYEVVIVNNQSVEQGSLDYFASFADHPKVRIRQHDHAFNYSTINNDAVLDCRGELICLLNNDIEVITPGWLEELASHAMREHVGAVGAMLYYPDDTIQHAGVIIGVHGVAAHPYSGMPRGHNGQMARAKLTQAMTAVTAACLMVRRDVYLQVGGLDSSLQVAFNDVDFCLRLAQRGYTNIWTPFAELYHHESASRGHENTPGKKARFTREVEFMKSRWGGQLEHDAAYNPNLTLSGEPFSLAFPPREWSITAAMPVADGQGTPNQPQLKVFAR